MLAGTEGSFLWDALLPAAPTAGSYLWAGLVEVWEGTFCCYLKTVTVLATSPSSAFPKEKGGLPVLRDYTSIGELSVSPPKKQEGVLITSHLSQTLTDLN